MATIHVTTPEGTSSEDYHIHIGRGLLAEAIQYPDHYGIRNPVIISNTTLAPLHAQALAAGFNAPLLTMPDGEAYKTLETVAMLYGEMVNAGADRRSTVIALGGGVVGDTAGFVAATYMRGVDFVQVPTSLLAMVDSSVGGKVGVDLPQGKNLVGAFKQPKSVLIDTEVLATLPDVEWQNGMAELIKHGLLADEGLLDTSLHRRENAAELVTRAVQVKVDVVQRDPYEHGERAHLNLGHTFAHAVEQVTNYAWAHGQAVGFGLMAAARLSYALGLCSAEFVDRVEGILAEAGLPRRLGAAIDPAALWAAMRTDKKWQGGTSRFVLLRDVCQPLIMEDIQQETVIDVLQGLR
ncbi:MAG: 3-dehydroquinate synthase [Chloroflexi bacterium AL-W]|nr:3-dehydroquinate synthase [Chloroflexi bacterium AL-W]